MKKLEALGFVDISYNCSVGCTRFEKYRKMILLQACAWHLCCKLESWSEYIMPVSLRDGLIDLHQDFCAPQQYIPLHLWDALRSVSDQSTSIYHPSPVSSLTENARNYVSLWCQAAREAHTLVAPSSPSAQQNSMPRIIWSFSFTDFLPLSPQSADFFWKHQRGSHLPFLKTIPHISLQFSLQALVTPAAEGCSNASRTPPQNSLSFYPIKSYPAQYLSASIYFMMAWNHMLHQKLFFHLFIY